MKLKRPCDLRTDILAAQNDRGQFGVRRLDAAFQRAQTLNHIQSAVKGTPREMLARGPRRRRTPNSLIDGQKPFVLNIEP